jgi:uncharacterized protein (DUF1015 family)
LIATEELDGERHIVWTITEPQAVKEFCDYFNDKPLYIADGHHRYESALTYKKDRSACDNNANPDAAYNFVMMTLLDMDDPNWLSFDAPPVIRFGISAYKQSGRKLQAFLRLRTYLLIHRCMAAGRPDDFI